MPIADLQRRDTEVGRIRLGKKTATGRADKLDTFRFTSADQAMIEEIAALYGGKAVPWTNDKKRHYEVITDKDVIPVYIPPQDIDPWYEQWGAGVCQRRCDGIRDIIHDQPCDCATDQHGKKSKCKPTTRVNLYLAEIPGMGVWRLETHGIYAAGEMVQLSDRINGIRVPLPARLHLEQRGRKFFNREKGKVETLDYPVPVLWLDSVTSRHVALGEDAVSQVVRAAAAQQIEAAEPAPALPAAPASPPPAARQQAPATPPPVDPELVQRALAMIATAAPEAMADMRERIRKTGDLPELISAFQQRLGQQAAAASAARDEQHRRAEGPWDTEEGWSEEEHAAEMQTARAAEQAPAAAPAATPEPEQPAPRTEAPSAAPQASEDRQAALTRLLGVAGAKGIKRAQLDERMQSDHDVTLKAATAAQLDALAASL